MTLLLRTWTCLALSLLFVACATRSPRPTAARQPEFVAMALDTEPQDVYVRIVDAGPGLCTVTRVPGPRFMVYDSGHWDGGRCLDAAKDLIGNHEIDLLILSHSDADHLGDGAAILKRFRVRQIWQTGDIRTTTTWKKLNAAIGKEASDQASVVNLATMTPAPGFRIPLGPATVTFLAGWNSWTGAGPTPSELRNAISIVVRLDYNGGSVLYTGDTVGRRLNDLDTACKDAEKVMVDRHNAGEISLASNVVIAPHHGGNNGSSTCFIEAVFTTIPAASRYVVFSSGHDHQHPTASAAARYLAAGVPLASIYRTDRGDDEAGTFEWKEGSVEGCTDDRGDDDVEIAIREDGSVEVDYRTADGPC